MSIHPTPKAVSLDEISPLLIGLINEGVDVTLTVTGCSMGPLLCNLRDAVVLTKCDHLELKKGQIPLYKRSNGQYVLHRIVKVNKTTYDIIGDNQSEIEYGVPKSSVICVVKAFYRKGKLHSCTEMWYRLYTAIWVLFRPFRKQVLSIYLFLSKFFKGGKK